MKRIVLGLGLSFLLTHFANATQTSGCEPLYSSNVEGGKETLTLCQTNHDLIYEFGLVDQQPELLDVIDKQKLIYHEGLTGYNIPTTELAIPIGEQWYLLTLQPTGTTLEVLEGKLTDTGNPRKGMLLSRFITLDKTFEFNAINKLEVLNNKK